jgi:NADH-quinone oxidoreductase subunit M
MGPLTLLLLIPLAGAFLLAFFPRTRTRAIKILAAFVVFADFALSVTLYLGFNAGSSAMQFVEQVAWIPQFGISYHVGIDGLSLLLVLLTTFLTAIAIPASFAGIKEREKEYYIFFLILEAAMLGVFVALDLFLFYVFWEFTLIPMAFLIGIWGHERRVYAAIKFILFTMFGSLLMLVGILALYFLNGARTFDLLELMKSPVHPYYQGWLFIAFTLAFAIKVPMFPFHTWLPDAHVEAPTAGSIILAGVLLKLGTYGLMRFCLGLFPQASREFAPLLIVLAIIGIIYGALVSIVQRDAKSLVAYSSVSHLGFIVLGLFAFNPQALSGAILQMVNHGLSTGALFLLVGILYERRHTRLIAEFGGLAKVMPVFAAFFLIMMFASAGLPGLNGFVGEFLILLGAFRANPWYAVFAATGVIVAAVYLLWLFQRVMHGEVTQSANAALKDLSAREIALLVAFVIVIVWIGVFPKTFLDPIQASVQNLLTGLASAQVVK